MAQVIPQSTDTLAADNHTLMHGVYSIDASSPSNVFYVNGSGQVRIGVTGTGPVAQLDVGIIPGSRLNSLRLVPGQVVTTANANNTLIAANIVKNTIFQQTGTAAATLTLDTGTNVSTAVPGTYQVGDMVFFVVSNASNQTIGVVGTTGFSVANTMNITTLQSRTFWAICTGTNTWIAY